MFDGVNGTGECDMAAESMVGDVGFCFQSIFFMQPGTGEKELHVLPDLQDMRDRSQQDRRALQPA